MAQYRKDARLGVAGANKDDLDKEKKGQKDAGDPMVIFRLIRYQALVSWD